MKKKIIDFKDTFIDNFLLARVKFVSFIKEHKLLSSFIALFIISGIIALIAFAQTAAYAKVTEVKVVANDIETESTENTSFTSFSTIAFDVQYVVDGFEEKEITTVAPVTSSSEEGQTSEVSKSTTEMSTINSNTSENTILEAGKIVITGTLLCGEPNQELNDSSCSILDFAWDQGDQSAVYVIENNKITVNIDNITKGSHSQKIYLKVGNVANGSKIQANFEVNGKKAEAVNLTIQSTKLENIEPILYPGPAQKVTSNIRNAIFGLALTLPSSTKSLKGLYIAPEYELLFSSYQTGSSPLKAEIINESESYGVYLSKLKYFNLPNGIYDISESSVYDSGKLEFINQISADEETLISNLYKFKVSNIKTDDNLYIMDEKIVLGTYFITVKSDRETNDKVNVNLMVTLGNNTAEAEIENISYSSGVRKLKMDIYEEKDDLDSSLVPIETIAYGEDFIAKTEFSHSKDADDSINELIIEIPASEQYKLISYGTLGEEIESYYINGITKEKNDYKVYYISKASDGSEVTYESYQVLEESNATLSKVKLVAKNVLPGTNIDFRLRYTLLAKNHNKDVTVKSTAKFGSSSLSAEGNSKITAFKIRGNVFIDENDKDVVIDGSNQSSSIIHINPILSMPSALINTNIEDVGEVDYIKIVATIPEGMKFIKSADTTNITYNDKNNTATIIIKDVKYNEWIEPVELEVGYDINIPNNTIKTVEFELQAYSKTKLEDVSSKIARTITRNIKYLNSEIIAYNQYAPVSNVAKNKSFSIVTDLKNTTDTLKEYELITILPHNLIGAEKQYYNGSYTLSNIEVGTLCTKEQGITDFTVYSNWVSCETYSSDNYKDVVAIKHKGKLEANSKISHTFNLIPKDNNTGDEYNFTSTLLYSEENSSNKVQKTLRTTKVSVVSKRISGIVWEDFNGDGIKQSSENTLADVKLNLYEKSSSGNELVDSTTSDSSGKYSFTDLKEGTYFVTAEFDHNKYGISPANATTDLALASRFSQKVLSEDSYYKFIWDKYTEYLKKAPLRTLYNKKEELFTDEVKEDEIVFKVKTEEKTLKSTFKYSKGKLSYNKISTDDEGLTLLVMADIFDALCNLRGYNYETITNWFSSALEEQTVIDENGIYIKLEKGNENNSEYIKILKFELDLANGISRFEKNNSAANMLGKVIASDDLSMESHTKAINNINLGLSLRKIYTVSLNKTITKVITTTNLGLVTTRNYDNASLAKIDVKDISNLSIKVVYNIELENTGFYPGYIFKVNDYIPDGMAFNPNDPLNKDWELVEDGYLVNRSLANDLIYGGEKRNITLSLDIIRKEAGSFINYASVEDEDLQILGGVSYE